MTEAAPLDTTHHRNVEEYLRKDHPEDDTTLVLECRACGARAEGAWAYEDDPERAVAVRLVMNKLDESPCVPERQP